LKEALEQEHEASSLSHFIDVPYDVDAQAERDQLTDEGNEGGFEEEEPESAEKKIEEAEKIADKSQKLEIECAVIEQQLKKMKE
jgi:hypothetical protein